MVAGGQQCLQGTQEKGSVMVVMVLPTPRKKKKTLFSTCQTFLAVYHDTNWVIICYRTHRMRKPVFCLETTSVIL